MKKLVILIICIVIGWNIYSGSYFAEKKVFLIKKLVDNVSTTPVSAEELKIAFEELMIHTCNLNGKNIRNGFGTVDDCLYNFDTLAAEQCISQIDDFESKIYYSKEKIKSDFYLLNKCADNIITKAYLSKYQ